MMKIKKKWVAIIAVCVVVVLGVTTFAFTRNKAPQVTVYRVARRPIEEYFSSTAKITAARDKSYYLATAAMVEDVFVKVGDTVTEGQQMAKLDVSAAQIQLKQARLQRESAETALKSAKDGTAKAASSLKELTNQIAAIEKQLKATNAELVVTALAKDVQSAEQSASDELKTLLADIEQRLNLLDGSNSIQAESALNQILTDIEATGETSQNPLDNLITEIKNAIKNYELSSQLQTLISQKAALSAQAVSGAQIAQLENALELAKLSEESAQKQYDMVKDGLIADFDGIVSAVNIVRDAPAPIGTACITLEDNSKVIAEISLGKYDVEKVKEGQQAKVSVPGHEYNAIVTRVNRVAQSASPYSAATGASNTSTLTAEVEILSPDDNLIIGFEADADILTGEAKNALALPLEAVKTDKNGSYCYMVENGIVQKIDLSFGISSDTYYEIKSGLKEKDVVIVNPSSDIEPGKKVAVIQ